MNWIRDDYGCIKLVDTFDAYYAEPENMQEVDLDAYNEAIRFLLQVESIQAINSRQVATMAIATAHYIFWSDV